MANSSKKFQVTQANDTIQECAENLYNALSEQGVEISKDRLFTDLTSLVQSHGNGEDSVRAEASASGPDTGHQDGVDTSGLSYMVSADLICMAYAHYHDGNTEKALRYAAVAFEENDAEDLFESLHEMNTLAESEDQLDNSDTSEGNEDTDGTEAEVSEASDSDMDLDGSDISDDTDLEDEVTSSEIDEDDDEDDDYNNEDDDDEDEDDEMDAESSVKSVASIVEANKQTKSGSPSASSEASSDEEPDREEIALANRVSISGSNNDRSRGRTLVRS